MGDRVKSEKGFATIYIVLLFSSILFCILVILEAASCFGAESISENASICAGRSLLGQYSKELYDRYGIFALRNYDYEMTDLASHYISDSIKATKTVIHLKLDECDIDFDSYPALSTSLFAKQIDKVAVLASVKKTHKATIEYKSSKGFLLPSKLLGYDSREIVSLSGGIFDISLESLLEDEYIINVTSNLLDEKEGSYLALETEYILYGYSSDTYNLGSIKRSIYALRYAENMAKAAPLPTDPAMLMGVIASIAVQTQSEVETIVNGGKVGDMGYFEYLRMLLKMLDTDEKMARLMDVIQINLQTMEKTNFSFSNYAYGFDLVAKFSKRTILPEYFGFEKRFKNFDMAFTYN